MMEQLLEWVAARVLELLTFVMGLLSASVFVVPDVTSLPQVRQVWSQNMAIVNTCYVLAIVAAGIVAMTHSTVQVRYSVKELVPRLVFAAVAANFSLTWLHMILQVANATTQAVAGAPLADAGSLRVIEAQVVAALTNPEVALLSLVVATVVMVLLFTLVVQWIIRFGLLLVVAVVAPFALACYCLPMLDTGAALWWRTLFGALAVHVLQALTLYTGLSVFLDPDAQLGSLLPWHADGQVTNLLVLLVLLLACVRIPALVRRYILRGGGGSGARVLGVLVVQQITRGLSRATGRAAKAGGR